MGPALSWLRDPLTVTLPVPTDLGSVDRAVHNPYSQWVFGRGEDFLPSARLTKETPSDFGYYIHCPELTTRGRPLDRGSVFQRISAQKTRDPDGTSEEETRGFIGLLPVRSRAVPENTHQAPPRHDPVPGLDPARIVVIGSIDDGINVFSRRFRPDAGPCRIDYAWVQEADAPNGTTVPFGRELTRNEITAALDRPDADETALIEKFGLAPAPNAPYGPSSLTRRVSHGTHITDLAAGYDCDETGCDGLRLVTVQLPALAVADTSGASLNTAIQAAAAYVFDRAYRMSLAYGTALPVVLNLSIGLTGGARGGQAFLERALRALSREYRDRLSEALGVAPPAVRVLPAGNHNLSGLHASGLEADGRLDVTLRLQPEDQTASFAEIWLRRNTHSADLRITLPDGSRHKVPLPDLADLPETPGDRAWLLAAPGPDTTPDPATAIARLTIDAPARDLPLADEADAEPLWWRIVLAINPTAHRVPDRAQAPFGPWRITVEASDGDGAPAGRIHAWALRDDRVPQASDIARQPYFDDPSYVEAAFDALGDVAVDDARSEGLRRSPLARDGNLSGLATNAPLPGDDPGDPLDSVVVGALRWDSGAAALYSSADFNRTEASADRNQAPHLLAAGETSRVLSGILGAGTFSGARVPLNGTSVATAVATRRLSHVLRDLPPCDYPDFVPVDAAMALGFAPQRPAPGDLEIASAPPVRVERLRDGGCLLPDCPGLDEAITRGVLAKRPLR